MKSLGSNRYRFYHLPGPISRHIDHDMDLSLTNIVLVSLSALAAIILTFTMGFFSGNKMPVEGKVGVHSHNLTI